MLDQFSNPVNVLAHYKTTGPEIIRDVPDLDIFVAGIGTGGTIMGVGKRLREWNSKIKVVGVEPYPQKTEIEGLRDMSSGFVPEIYNEEILDEKILVRDVDAFETAKELFLKEGLLVGISSGAAMVGALKMAKRLKKGKIVVLFPDRGERYLSTKLFRF